MEKGMERSNSFLCAALSLLCDPVNALCGLIVGEQALKETKIEYVSIVHAT